MTDQDNMTNEVVDNQTDLTIEETPVSGEEQTPSQDTQESTTEETIEQPDQPAQPEFSDPNMQARFTERMTELKRQEDEFNANKSGFETKSQAFDRLAQIPEFRKWYKEYSGNGKTEEPEPVLSDEAFYEITQDKDKLIQFIGQQAEKKVQKLIQPRLESMEKKYDTDRFAGEIDAFASSPGHEDFWDLDQAGKIKPILKMFGGLKVSALEKLDMAYKLSKYPDIQKEAIVKAHQRAEEKKQLSGDKGVSNEAAIKKSTKGMSMEEFVEHEMKTKGLSF